jgi:photosystem II stability/assembly factor-like uncharacterized protein
MKATKIGLVFACVGMAVAAVGCSSSDGGDQKTPPGSSDGGSGTTGGDGGTSTTPTPTTPPAGWRSAVGLGGIFAQTFDEVSWQTRVVAPGDLYAVACSGNLRGWAAGTGGFVAHTEDGGQTWSPQATHLSSTLRAIRFGDASLGVVAGDGGALATTHDGGATWEPKESGATGALRGAAIADAVGLVAVVGDGGVLLLSQDRGETFAKTSIAGADLQAVATDDAAHVVLAVDAQGRVWESGDRGATFHVEATAPGAAALHGVAFGEDGGSALAVGDDGVALARAADGAWSPVATGTHETLHAALVTYTGSFDYVAGDHGTLLARARTAGAAFTPVASGTTADLYGLEDL